MMNDVYTRSCPEDRVLKIQQTINGSEHFKDKANAVEFCLLKCYLAHRVTEYLKYEVREL